jgi:CBS domain-containing protein
MKVKEVMHRGVTWVEPNTSVREIAQMMRDGDIGSVPIGENDRLVGIVTDRDIICRGIADSADCNGLTARDVMSKPIIYCRTDDELEYALRIMEKNKIRRLPVIDENKRLAGMLALGDISEIGGEEMAGEVMRSVSAHHA